MNKASGGDGIPVELFQILKDDAVEVLHSICQQIWKTQQWPQDCKRSVFIPIPKKGKLEVVKYEMGIVNVNILGISELKWTGIGEFNSDDHYTYCGQESLRRNGVAIMVNKRV